MTPKVSILVPVYNVSGFIERCAHSLFSQTFPDIEYVFVNDVSTDDSIEKLLKVLDIYSERKSNVKIINHTINRGPAAARNTAVNNSTGRYILFVDSDDYIEPDMVEVLYNKIVKEQSNIVVSDIFFEYENDTKVLFDRVSGNREENILNILLQEGVYCCLWNKLVERRLYEENSPWDVEGLRYSEDRYTMTLLYYYANKISKVNKPLYHYVQYNSNSITKQKTKIHFDNSLLFWEKTDEFFKEKGIYKQYLDTIELSKVKNKASLMMDTDLVALRKKYVWIFSDIEKKYVKQLKKGERIMLFLLRLRLFRTAQVFRRIVWYKNK